MLLVIDNVWSAEDLAPFLMGGPSCVRLVTTRNARTCPPITRVMHLGAMSADQIDCMLRRSLPGVQTGGGELDLSEVAGLWGGWPLLAKVLGSSMEQEVEAGAQVKTVVEETRRELLVAGPSAFDVLDSSQRLSAISQVMHSSLDQLEAQVAIGAHGGLREKYQQLGRWWTPLWLTVTPLFCTTYFVPICAPVSRSTGPSSTGPWWRRSPGWSAGIGVHCRSGTHTCGATSHTIWPRRACWQRQSDCSRTPGSSSPRFSSGDPNRWCPTERCWTRWEAQWRPRRCCAPTGR